MTRGTVENAFVNDYRISPVDPRITYPSYKSFDDLIDVSFLLSLDDYLTAKIEKYRAADHADYFLNLYRLDGNTPYQPGVKEIWLSRTRGDLPFEYLDMVDSTDIWEPTPESEDFPYLMEFIQTLPFKETGRVLLIYDDSGKEVPAHRDHMDIDVCNEFIWFRTNENKRFYVFNNQTGEKKYVESYSAWFDAVNQYHGSDAVPGLSFSFRVDGIFTDEFRTQIPRPEFNLASTPALWASM